MPTSPRRAIRNRRVPILQVRKAIDENPAPKPLKFQTLTLDPHTGIVIVGDAAAQLQPGPAKLLAGLIMAHRGILTTEAAFDVLYWRRSEAEKPQGDNAVTMQFYWLRKDLRRLGFGIENVKGFGWRLVKVP